MKEKNENGGASPTLQFIVSWVGAILVLRSLCFALRNGYAEQGANFAE